MADDLADTLPTVPPAPLPMVINVLQIKTPNGSLAVQLRISSPAGISHFFFSPDEAMRIAKELEQKGQAGKAGLHLPEGAN